MSTSRHYAPLGARTMGHFLGARSTPRPSKGPTGAHGARGPLSGTRVRILPGHPREGLTGTLKYCYLHEGAYYVRLDQRVNGDEWETVVRPPEWERLA